MAQIIVSVQMVYEERVINKRNVPPLAAVGWEGMFVTRSRDNIKNHDQLN